MNSQAMSSFETQKNTRALSYTALICAVILLIAILYTWPLSIPPKPIVQDLIEINLGNDVEGMGDVQPLVKGDRAPEDETVNSPEKSAPVKDEPAKSIAANEDDDDPDAAEVPKPLTPKKEAVTLPKETVTKTVKTNNTTPVTNPNPAPPKPKVPLYKGGTGPGGNGATSDNGFRNQGYKQGNGDAGSPTGNPDSYGKNPGGKVGFQVKGLSGRKPIRFPSFQDEFNEKATVYVDIKVNGSGTVTSASIARGTTTSNGNMRSIALSKAKQLKFPPSENEVESGTLTFNFILQN